MILEQFFDCQQPWSKERAGEREVWDQRVLFAAGPARRLRWFVLPVEAKQLLCFGGGSGVPEPPPFQPVEYPSDAALVVKSVSDVGSVGGGGSYSVDDRVMELVLSIQNGYPEDEVGEGILPKSPDLEKAQDINSGEGTVTVKVRDCRLKTMLYIATTIIIIAVAVVIVFTAFFNTSRANGSSFVMDMTSYVHNKTMN